MRHDFYLVLMIHNNMFHVHTVCFQPLPQRRLIVLRMLFAVCDAFSLRSILSLLTLIIVIGLLIWLSFNVDIPSPDALREIIQGYGWAGWLIFIGITALIAITPIPVTIPALVAGSLYGVIAGSIFSFSGIMI